jgi:DNA (cytosine-5)-methyltransferase 1
MISCYLDSIPLPLRPTVRYLRDVIQDLLESEQHFVKFPEKRLKYYRLLKSGQYWRSLPIELHQEALGA